MMDTLQQIGVKYGTDKSIHKYHNITYLDIYDKYFNNIRNDVKKILEIGILNGLSLLMWKEYFPNATIYGIDINPDCKKFEDDRIKIYIGDQSDYDFLNKVKEEIGLCDIILDDGSHITKHQIVTYDVFNNSVIDGGYYVIEDLRNSYEEFSGGYDLRNVWPGMTYNNINDPLKNYRKDFNEWIESKIKDLDFHKQNMKLFSIHFYPMIVIFENLK